MDAQKIRTPKGLDFLKKVGLKDNHQQALQLMRGFWQSNCTIWAEGVWEILSCDNSPTKFIISDSPVTTYNKGLFPGAKECTYPFDASIFYLGTHTIFPLSINRCLVIANLGYVRNPSVNPLKKRINPRYFADSIFDLRKIQKGRQIGEEYVLAINYVLKTRAKRYIASSRKDWLFPEKKMKKTLWSKIGGKTFLMPDPRKVGFSTQFVARYASGKVWGQDEYGRWPDEKDPEVKMLRKKEWDTYQKAVKSWDDMFGVLDPKDSTIRF
ncbi:DUF4238 domain-containing protein [Cellvibrio sp. UBA7671]|uniref:DUF4238 domain-containing protein n=1 Tax=Cellvibrio sp. UBA7671 TaxID=1946312 RepID=UPI002F357198